MPQNIRGSLQGFAAERPPRSPTPHARALASNEHSALQLHGTDSYESCVRCISFVLRPPFRPPPEVHCPNIQQMVPDENSSLRRLQESLQLPLLARYHAPHIENLITSWRPIRQKPCSSIDRDPLPAALPPKFSQTSSELPHQRPMHLLEAQCAEQPCSQPHAKTYQ